MRELPLRTLNLLTCVVLAAVCVPAWWVAAGSMRHAAGMSMASAMSPGPIGWLTLWTFTVAAMMIPVAAPSIIAYRFVVQPWGSRGVLATANFVAGYLACWAVMGLVPLALHRWLPLARLAPVTAVSLVLAGLFQFSSLKQRCLRVCRSPLQFAVSQRFTGRLSGACRAGLTYGAFCIGCCWALMALQVVLASQSLLLMLTASLVMLLERMTSGRIRLDRILGSTLAAAGVTLMCYSALVQP